MRGCYAVERAVADYVMNAIHFKEAFKIERACFVDGNDDEFQIEFWIVDAPFGERIYRTEYSRRTTITTIEVVADRDAHRMLMQLAAADLVCTVGIC